MSIATGTATTAEIVTLYVEVAKLEVMLRSYNQGDALGAPTNKAGRFSGSAIDTQITAVQAAITAINA